MLQRQYTCARLAGLLAAFLLLAAALPDPAFAQSATGAISFAWGEEYELPRRHEDLGFLGNATDGYVQIGHREHSSLSFQKFSTDLHLVSEKEVPIEQLPRLYD